MRTPTASWIAFAIAAETPNVPVSPTPFAPNGPLSWRASTMSFTKTGGTSRMPGIL